MADGQEAGDIRSSAENLALAMPQLDALEKELNAREARVLPRIPTWVRRPHPTASAGTA